jgi:hypothetical protein
MKKIVCELCEGTVFDKIDGRFVCKGCGTSYSVEEAKGMMQEVEGEEPAAGSPVVSMPQSNVNQQQLDNILMLATNAYSASNNEETEKYCNRAIELDATCYKAWLLKGKAIGWSSTVQNPRISEAAHSFKQAVDFAPDEEKENVRVEASEELKRLGLACMSLRQKRFSQYPDKEELNGFVSDVELLIDGLAILLAGEGVTGETSEADALIGLLGALSNVASIKFIGMKSKAEKAGVPKEYFTQIATMMGNAAVDGFNTASKGFENDSHPLQNDLVKYMNEIDNCIMLADMAIDASDDDDDADITRYNNKIKMEEYVINMKAYDSYSSSYRSIALTDEAKKNRRETIDDCKKKIREIEQKAKEKEEEERKKAEEEKKARIAAYWEAHADEKAKLEAEKKELIEKRDRLQKELNDVSSEIQSIEKEKSAAVPSETEKSKVEDQIRDLNNRRSKLGMFAGKEKKQIAEEIASLEGRVDSLKGKIEEEKKEKAADVERRLAPVKARKSELDSELAPITKRISAIDAEFSKDPEA